MTSRAHWELPADPAQALRQWAAELLGARLEEGPAAMRERVMSQLAISDGAPLANWHEAVDALFRPRSEFRWDDWPEFRRAMEARLIEEIAGFAGRLRKTSAAQHAGEWKVLSEWCSAFPIFERRLSALLPALEVDLSDQLLPEGRTGDLMRLAQELVLLPLPKRTRRRIEALEAMYAEPDLWEGAARQVQQDYPQIAELVPELFTELASISSRREAASRLRWRRSSSESGPPSHEAEEPAVKRRLPHQLEEIVLSRHQVFWLLCLVALAVASIIRILSK